MKLLKKAGAVFLALAMIAVIIPQLGSKVVKAAEGIEYIYNKDNKSDSHFAIKSLNVLDCPASNFTGGGLKANSAIEGSTFTVAANKYAIVEFDLNTRYANNSCCIRVKNAEGSFIGEDSIQEHPELRILTTNQWNKDVVADHFMLPVVCPSGTYTLVRDTTLNKEGVLYQIKLTEYDSNDAAQEKVAQYIKDMTETVKYKVSGTISSEVDLTGGKVTLVPKSSTGTTAKAVASNAITSNEDGTYHYEVENVVGKATYSVAIDAQGIIEAEKHLDREKLATVSFTVEEASKENADFTVPYIAIAKNWDFQDIDKWDCSYGTNKNVIYKGLIIETGSTGKFAVDLKNSRIQINKGTKVKIPVSGWGTVTCEFAGTPDSTTTLGTTKGSGVKDGTLSFRYENANYVELSIGAANEGLYLKSIKAVSDETPAVARLGAAVRQETAGWGNGIRFGAALDLTKVDKDACTSGTLIGLESIVGAGKEMTMDDAGKTCLNVVRTTFIKEENNQLDYAAALINIPEEQKNTKIVARSYVKVGDNVYYGEQQTATWNGVAAAVQ